MGTDKPVLDGGKAFLERPETRRCLRQLSCMKEPGMGNDRRNACRGRGKRV